MDDREALKHLRTLINVACQADDREEIQKILREMEGVINNVLPPPQPRRRAF